MVADVGIEPTYNRLWACALSQSSCPHPTLPGRIPELVGGVKGPVAKVVTGAGFHEGLGTVAIAAIPAMTDEAVVKHGGIRQDSARSRVFSGWRRAVRFGHAVVMTQHPWTALFLAPIKGAAFVIFLPIVGFVMLGVALYETLRRR